MVLLQFEASWWICTLIWLLNLGVKGFLYPIRLFFNLRDQIIHTLTHWNEHMGGGPARPWLENRPSLEPRLHRSDAITPSLWSRVRRDLAASFPSCREALHSIRRRRRQPRMTLGAEQMPHASLLGFSRCRVSKHHACKEHRRTFIGFVSILVIFCTLI